MSINRMVLSSPPIIKYDYSQQGLIEEKEVMNNEFSQKITEIVSQGKIEATRLHSSSVSPEHLLLGLIRRNPESTRRIFDRLNVNMEKIINDIEIRLKDLKIKLGEQKYNLTAEGFRYNDENPTS